MNLFNRVPGFPHTPAGRERVVLRLLPRAFLIGTLLLAIPSLLARLVASPENALAVTTTDIYVISFIILHWTDDERAGLCRRPLSAGGIGNTGCSAEMAAA